MAEGEASSVLGEGIIVFTLWYLGIAYNYYTGDLPLKEGDKSGEEHEPGKEEKRMSQGSLQTTEKTQAASPEQSPLRRQAASPAQSPLRTQAASPAQSPLRTQAASPTQSPLRTQAASQAQSPLRTQAASPAQSPLRTQAASPAQSPLRTQAASPAQSPPRTQAASPAQSPLRTQTASLVGVETPPPEEVASTPRAEVPGIQVVVSLPPVPVDPEPLVELAMDLDLAVDGAGDGEDVAF